jgi:hypothetical protein
MPFRPINPPSSPAAGFDSPRARTRTPRATDPAPPKRNGGTSDNKRLHHKVDRTGPNWNEDGDYLVGKFRPPQATQWKKGQSGNPQGPVKRETLSAQAQFEQTFLAPFTATVNGEAVPLTMDVFAVQTLKSAAAKGSVKAAQILLDFYVTLIRKAADREPGPEIERWEQEAIDRVLAELDLPARPVVRQTNRKDAK